MATPTQLSTFSQPFGTPALRAQPKKPFSTRYPTLGVSEILGQRENHATGYDENNQPLAPGTQFFSPGWNAKFGPQQGGDWRIGSAAGAVGSSGIPTSQRGRAEKYGGFVDDGRGGQFFQPNTAAAELPTWAVGNMQNQQGGLSQSWRYGGMGQLPPPAFQQPNVNAVTPMQQPAAPASTAPQQTVSPMALRDGMNWFQKLMGGGMFPQVPY